MKAVILAAGYGTRLQRDVAADRSGRFAHLVGIAKPLLPTNALYLPAFEEWAANFPNVSIVSDQTRSNDARLGAVACLQLAVKHFQIEDHVFVIGGDTLFQEDFSLAKLQSRFFELQVECEDNSVLLSYQCRDDETHKYGIVEVDGKLRALNMKEKPLPTETKSRRACPCFYVLSKKSLPQLDNFLQDKKVMVIICTALSTILYHLNQYFNHARMLLCRKKTPLETLCLGSFHDNLCMCTRLAAVSTWETCSLT
ncbi:uncharacterized protein zgc:136439 isoform X3 [Corythoichthys intestinalis]|uniref:uncharacterized protein zgc:136439 isoform X3 n=1 Tax=Corythoichthys intestinalis TaxID=161448 RepID=UPI0025A4F4BD|nr:uncharacterized protein zgc:136439 isoform X3 [Corythoichthys intestinalis]